MSEILEQLHQEYNAAIANGMMLKARMIERRIRYMESARGDQEA